RSGPAPAPASSPLPPPSWAANASRTCWWASSSEPCSFMWLPEGPWVTLWNRPPPMWCTCTAWASPAWPSGDSSPSCGSFSSAEAPFGAASSRADRSCALPIAGLAKYLPLLPSIPMVLSFLAQFLHPGLRCRYLALPDQHRIILKLENLRPLALRHPQRERPPGPFGLGRGLGLGLR